MLLLVFYSCDRNKKEAIDSIVKNGWVKNFYFLRIAHLLLMIIEIV